MIEPTKIFDLKSVDENRRLSPTQVELSWHVDPGLSYFNGHFPDYPVLPAVAIIDATVAFFAQCFTRDVGLEEMISCKFTGAIRPGMDVILNLTDINQMEIHARWFLPEGDQILADLRLRIA